MKLRNQSCQLILGHYSPTAMSRRTTIPFAELPTVSCRHPNKGDLSVRIAAMQAFSVCRLAPAHH